LDPLDQPDPMGLVPVICVPERRMERDLNQLDVFTLPDELTG
jgi:hypothetical protein